MIKPDKEMQLDNNLVNKFNKEEDEGSQMIFERKSINLEIP